MPHDCKACLTNRHQNAVADQSARMTFRPSFCPITDMPSRPIDGKYFFKNKLNKEQNQPNLPVM